MSETSISRRSLLKMSGLAAAGIAAGAALGACSPAASSGEGAGKESGDATVAQANTGAANGSASTQAASGSSWRTPPAEVTDFVNEYDYEVVCVGHGYAGMCACRELAESGKKVALIEVQAEDTYTATGNESAALNSKLLDRFDIPHVDPVEYYQNWMAMTQNYPNGELVMKFCQNMGEANDWYYSVLSEDELATMTSHGWPSTKHRLTAVGPFKFYPGTATFEAEGVKQTQILTHNREAAQKLGADFYFQTEAQYLVMDNGAVAGLVASTPEGNVKFNCKAVVVATGGFCNNNEMLADLIPDMIGNFVEGEEVAPEGGNGISFGRGIQMAYWAGARLEQISIPTMNGKHLDPPTNRTNVPQAVWLDSNGKRFCNEFFPAVEHRGVPTIYRERQDIHCVFDSDILTYLEYCVPQHGTFNPTESALEGVRKSMDVARAKFEGTYDESKAEEFRSQVNVTACADTLEGLAEQIGLTGDAAKNFVESVNRYNEFCETGVDMEFGRYKETLFPVVKPPFYAATGTSNMGKIMCTVGGIITDGEQNALDANFRPIPGLYVSGNDCGRRFGNEYFTPTPGVSLGMAITLGRECGRSVKAFLEA